MWRTRTLLLTGLAVLGILILAAVAAASAAQPTAPAKTSGCDVKYHPVAGCSVPNGGTLDPCSTVTAGTVHCAFTLPDFNPADWAGFIACEIVSGTGAVAQAIETAIGNFIVWLLNSLFSDFLAPLATLENALASAVVSAVDWFGGVVTGAFTSLNTLAQPLGPLSPIVVVAATIGIFLVAGIALYFLSIFLWASFKTVFNLL